MEAISKDGTPIYYRRRGEGIPVLFVHGAATGSGDWSFLDVPFEVIAMDRRGRGKSGDDPDYAIEKEAEDVLAVLEATGARHLVGHSYGALCSILAVQQTKQVDRFVMYEPPIGYRGGREIPADPGAALTAFLSGAGTSPEQLELIRSSPAWPVLLDAMPSLPRELDACARWVNPSGPIDVPTLYLIGEDTTNPSYTDGLDELLAAFTDVERRTVPGLHVAHVFAAREFGAVVSEFLGQPLPQP